MANDNNNGADCYCTLGIILKLHEYESVRCHSFFCTCSHHDDHHNGDTALSSRHWLHSRQNANNAHSADLRIGFSNGKALATPATARGIGIVEDEASSEIIFNPVHR